jgi:phospholipid-binding lipoprotein MlaA
VSIVSSSRVIGRWIGIALLVVGNLIGGCATPPSDPEARAQFERNNDPLEPLNRKTFALNQFLDHALFKPAAQAYLAVVPADARTAVHHMLDNMKEPTLFFNNVLQGEFKRAEITLGRFVVDTTVGFGGMVDVMTLSGVERQPADFGQTLFVWGLPAGPYLILPILGPTDPRDAVGSAVDSYADPFTIVANDHGVTELTTARFIVGGVEERARVMDVLDDLEKNSIDYYAEMRSLWQQHRDAELRHGKAPQTVPGLYDDPGQGATPASPAKPGAINSPPAHMTANAGTMRHPPATYHSRQAAQKSLPGHHVSQCGAPHCAAPTT